MSHSYNAGNAKEGYEYTNSGVVVQVWRSGLRIIARLLKGHFDALKGGIMTRVGGEFLFEARGEGNTSITWCHRMEDIRDHSKVETLRKILNLDQKDS
jgi:hypothetical protein